MVSASSALRRIITWNSAMRSRASTKLGTPASIAAIVTVAAFVSKFRPRGGARPAGSGACDDWAATKAAYRFSTTRASPSMGCWPAISQRPPCAVRRARDRFSFCRTPPSSSIAARGPARSASRRPSMPGVTRRGSPM